MGRAELMTHVNYETGSCCINWVQDLFMFGDVQRIWSSGGFNAEDCRKTIALPIRSVDPSLFAQLIVGFRCI